MVIGWLEAAVALAAVLVGLHGARRGAAAGAALLLAILLGLAAAAAFYVPAAVALVDALGLPLLHACAASALLTGLIVVTGVVALARWLRRPGDEEADPGAPTARSGAARVGGRSRAAGAILGATAGAVVAVGVGLVSVLDRAGVSAPPAAEGSLTRLLADVVARRSDAVPDLAMARRLAVLARLAAEVERAGPAAMQAVAQGPRVRELLDDPAVVKALGDGALADLAAGGHLTDAVRHPRLVELLRQQPALTAVLRIDVAALAAEVNGALTTAAAAPSAAPPPVLPVQPLAPVEPPAPSPPPPPEVEPPAPSAPVEPPVPVEPRAPVEPPVPVEPPAPPAPVEPPAPAPPIHVEPPPAVRVDEPPAPVALDPTPGRIGALYAASSRYALRPRPTLRQGEPFAFRARVEVVGEAGERVVVWRLLDPAQREVAAFTHEDRRPAASGPRTVFVEGVVPQDLAPGRYTLEVSLAVPGRAPLVSRAPVEMQETACLVRDVAWVGLPDGPPLDLVDAGQRAFLRAVYEVRPAAAGLPRRVRWSVSDAEGLPVAGLEGTRPGDGQGAGELQLSEPLALPRDLPAGWYRLTVTLEVGDERRVGHADVRVRGE